MGSIGYQVLFDQQVKQPAQFDTYCLVASNSSLMFVTNSIRSADHSVHRKSDVLNVSVLNADHHASRPEKTSL